MAKNPITDEFIFDCFNVSSSSIFNLKENDKYDTNSLPKKNGYELKSKRTFKHSNMFVS